jgi:ribosome biogenesis GTPase
MKPLSLASLGFDESFAAQVFPHESALIPGRIAFETRGIYHVMLDGGGTVLCELRGILRKGVTDRNAYPVVGDWVLTERQNERRGLIVRALERRNALIRREQARREAERRHSQFQVLAANVDYGLITTSLNEDWNARRLERYLGLVRDAQVQPAILLTKTDLTDDKGAEGLEATRALAGDAPIIPLSMQTGQGLPELKALLGDHSTAVLLGSSGVGKSTLVNALLGNEVMATNEIRERDSKGRHTTVGRHLLPLPWGGCLIDSPGLRDLGLVDEKAVDAAFDDILALAATCKYSDCQHAQEPGCAVRNAIEAGTLDAERFESYQKLSAETAAAAKRQELGAERFQREKGKGISRVIKDFYKKRPGGKR